MNRVVIDAATAAAFQAAAPGTEIVDPNGKLIGGFVPMNMARDLERLIAERKRRYDEAWEDFDLEELKAIEAEGGEIPHEEVMKRLGLE
jgi:hypothetical protein